MTYEEIRNSPKSFQEDYSHENGNYYCTCYKCKELFIGHKRRVVCKECQVELEEETKNKGI